MCVTRCPICDGTGRVKWAGWLNAYVGADDSEGRICHGCHGEGLFFNPPPTSPDRPSEEKPRPSSP